VAEFGPPTPVTCAGCGLLCDDVTVERKDDAVRLRPPCRLGTEWFSERIRRPANAPAAIIRGQEADVETALTRAAELLRGARRPLLHGFDGATVEDARVAVALADRLGALIATDGVSDAWPGAAAIPLRGASTATLGEIRDRSRLLVVWREDPMGTHPRLLERLGFGAPLGAERTLVVVDDRDTATVARADVQLRWPRDCDLEALVTLHALHRRRTLPASDLVAQLSGLLERINGVPHVAFVHGPGLTAAAGGQRRALALHELVRGLCHERHAVTLALPGAAGTTGSQDALAWQTGYGGSVDLASGHPELVTATQPLAAGEGVDVALRIEGGPAQLPAGVVEIAMCSLPAGLAGPEVAIRTAAAGVEATGTAHRLDGVPLALQAPLPGDAPTAAVLLTRLLAEVRR
jgi:formylmethanofuran dehydrogenase subunit B